MNNQLSELAQAIEKRGRYQKTVDMASVLGGDLLNHDGSPVTAVCYQINNKYDDNEAIVMAYAQVADLAVRAGQAKEDIKRDQDFIADHKLVQALYRACRDPKDPSKPLFPSPGWMLNNLDTDTLAGLVNGYNRVKDEKMGVPDIVDEAFVKVLREHSFLHSSETFLPKLPRSVLEKIILVALQVWDVEQTGIKEVLKDVELSEEVRKALADFGV